MSAQIIPFSVRQTPEWPDGVLGEELENLAQLIFQRRTTTGADVSIERARRCVLEGLREAEAVWREQ